VNGTALLKFLLVTVHCSLFTSNCSLFTGHPKDMSVVKTHKDLQVWQKAMDLVVEVYETTKKFPANEIYGLTNQIRRSVVSIPSNIAEGAARQTEKEFLQFLYIAYGSLAELETQLILATRLNYTETVHTDALEQIRKMLSGLINNIKARKG